MSDDIMDEVEEIPSTPCGSCAGTGEILVGWDEDGSDVFGPCVSCGGTGTQ